MRETIDSGQWLDTSRAEERRHANAALAELSERYRTWRAEHGERDALQSELEFLSELQRLESEHAAKVAAIDAALNEIERFAPLDEMSLPASYAPMACKWEF